MFKAQAQRPARPLLRKVSKLPGHQSHPLVGRLCNFGSGELAVRVQNRILKIICCVVLCLWCSCAIAQTRSIEELRQRAESGDAYAEELLGARYGIGSGVPKNIQESLRWLRKAATQGNAEAQFTLGLAYDDGSTVAAQDYPTAIRWYRMAANQGHAHAQYNLATMCEEGKGTPPNIAEAIKWYRAAAKQGEDRAIARLKTLTQLLTEK